MKHIKLNKKIITAICIALCFFASLVGIGSTVYAARGRTGQPQLDKALYEDLYYCYNNNAMLNNFSVSDYKYIKPEAGSTVTFSVVSNNLQLALPTQVWANTEDKVHCRGLLTRENYYVDQGILQQGFVFDGFDGLFDENSVPATSPARASESEIDKFLTDTLGYTTTGGGTGQKCVYFEYKYDSGNVGDKTNRNTVNICANVDASGNITSDLLEQKPALEPGLNTYGSTDTIYVNNTDLCIKQWNSLGWDEFLGKADICQTFQVKGKKWDTFKDEAYAFLISNEPSKGVETIGGGGFYYKIVTSGGAHESGADVISKTYKDPNVFRAIAAAGGTDISTYSGLAYSDDELFKLYKYYLENVYKSQLHCGTGSTTETATYENANNYSKFTLTDGGQSKTCYANIPENKNDKVNGIKSDRHFDPTGNTKINFDQLIAALNGLNVTANLPSDLSETVQEEDKPESSTEVTSESDCAKATSLGWILCPILKGLGNAVINLYNDIVEPFLVFDSSLFGQGSNGMRSAWVYFRDFANVALVIFILVVIISQVTGFGIDNYGIKKALPKIIVAAILINISFFVCQIAVDLSNILGVSLRALFEGMAPSLAAPSLPPNDPGFMSPGTGITLGATAIAVGMFALFSNPAGWAALLAFIPAIIAALIGAIVSIFFFFMLLGLRNAAVIILICLSPLAFACQILPNTKKMFDKWLKGFEALLLVFPIAGLLMGGGTFVSAVLLNSKPDDFMTALVAMLVQIVPFFFIPKLLQGSFAALGNIGAKVAGFGQRWGGRARGATKGLVANSEVQRSMMAKAGQQNANRLNRKLEDIAQKQYEKNNAGKKYADLTDAEKIAYKEDLAKSRARYSRLAMGAAMGQKLADDHNKVSADAVKSVDQRYRAAQLASAAYQRQEETKNQLEWNREIKSFDGANIDEYEHAGATYHKSRDGEYYNASTGNKANAARKQSIEAGLASGATTKRSTTYHYDKNSKSYSDSTGTRSLTESKMNSLVSDGRATYDNFKYVQNASGSWISADGKSTSTFTSDEMTDLTNNGIMNTTTFSEAKSVEAEAGRYGSLGNVASYAGMNGAQADTLSTSKLRSATTSGEIQIDHSNARGTSGALRVERNEAQSQDNAVYGRAAASAQMEAQGISTVQSVQSAQNSAQAQFVNVATQNAAAPQTAMDATQVQQAVDTGSTRLVNQFTTTTAGNEVGVAEKSYDVERTKAKNSRIVEEAATDVGVAEKDYDVEVTKARNVRTSEEAANIEGVALKDLGVERVKVRNARTTEEAATAAGVAEKSYDVEYTKASNARIVEEAATAAGVAEKEYDYEYTKAANNVLMENAVNKIGTTAITEDIAKNRAMATRIATERKAWSDQFAMAKSNEVANELDAALKADKVATTEQDHAAAAAKFSAAFQKLATTGNLPALHRILEEENATSGLSEVMWNQMNQDLIGSSDTIFKQFAKQSFIAQGKGANASPDLYKFVTGQSQNLVDASGNAISMKNMTDTMSENLHFLDGQDKDTIEALNTSMLRQDGSGNYIYQGRPPVQVKHLVSFATSTNKGDELARIDDAIKTYGELFKTKDASGNRVLEPAAQQDLISKFAGAINGSALSKMSSDVVESIAVAVGAGQYNPTTKKTTITDYNVLNQVFGSAIQDVQNSEQLFAGTSNSVRTLLGMTGGSGNNSNNSNSGNSNKSGNNSGNSNGTGNNSGNSNGTGNNSGSSGSSGSGTPPSPPPPRVDGWYTNATGQRLRGYRDASGQLHDATDGGIILGGTFTPD